MTKMIIDHDLLVVKAALNLLVLTRKSSVLNMVEGRIQMLLGILAGLYLGVVFSLVNFLVGKWISNAIILRVATHIYHIDMCVSVVCFIGCMIAYIIAVNKAAKE